MTGPEQAHDVRPLPGAGDWQKCSCGRLFASVRAVCPGDRAYWAVPAESPDAILHRILRAARQRLADPLALDVLALHELLRAGVPFPTCWAADATEPRPVEDVPAPGLLSAPEPDIIIGESD